MHDETESAEKHVCFVDNYLTTRQIYTASFFVCIMARLNDKR